MGTAYGVAFKNGKFLMVFNVKRNGWEMPGGSIESGESVEDAVKREFLEESGYNIEVIEIRDLGTCHACACKLLEKVNSDPEMISDLFEEVPEQIFFDRSEYDEVIPWARSVVNDRKPPESK